MLQSLAAPPRPRCGREAAPISRGATYPSNGSVMGKLAAGRGLGRGFIRWPGSTTHLFGPDVSGQALHHMVQGSRGAPRGRPHASEIRSRVAQWSF